MTCWHLAKPWRTIHADTLAMNMDKTVTVVVVVVVIMLTVVRGEGA